MANWPQRWQRTKGNYPVRPWRGGFAKGQAAEAKPAPKRKARRKKAAAAPAAAEVAANTDPAAGAAPEGDE